MSTFMPDSINYFRAAVMRWRDGTFTLLALISLAGDRCNAGRPNSVNVNTLSASQTAASFLVGYCQHL